MICDEEGELKRGRGCISQIYAVRWVCKKYVAKSKDVFWTSLYIEKVEKAHDESYREGLWSVLRLYELSDVFAPSHIMSSRAHYTFYEIIHAR